MADSLGILGAGGSLYCGGTPVKSAWSATSNANVTVPSWDYGIAILHGVFSNIKFKHPTLIMRVGCLLVENFAHGACMAANAASTEASIIGRPYGYPVDSTLLETQSTVIEGVEGSATRAHIFDTDRGTIAIRFHGGHHRGSSREAAIRDLHNMRSSQSNGSPLNSGRHGCSSFTSRRDASRLLYG